MDRRILWPIRGPLDELGSDVVLGTRVTRPSMVFMFFAGFAIGDADDIRIALAIACVENTGKFVAPPKECIRFIDQQGGLGFLDDPEQC